LTYLTLCIYLCWVRTNNRRFGVIFLVALYCFASGLVSFPHPYDDLKSIPFPKDQSHFTSDHKSVFSHTTPTERNLTNPNHPTDAGFKIPFKGIRFSHLTSHGLDVYRYVRLNAHLIDFLIHHRQSAMMFPYHFFW
jgi:hypothetical protein